ncbi:MAG: hypothetical protein R3324_13690 [Halobacteriales archaeon]|nr:hypothetical protein [Halobacteriales archaeon]
MNLSELTTVRDALDWALTRERRRADYMALADDPPSRLRRRPRTPVETLLARALDIANSAVIHFHDTPLPLED